MNKEIEEMANSIPTFIKEYENDTRKVVLSGALKRGISIALYNAGYRKVYPIVFEDKEYTEEQCEQDMLAEAMCDSCQRQAVEQAVKEYVEKLWMKAKENGVKNPLMGVRVSWRELNETLKEVIGEKE